MTGERVFRTRSVRVIAAFLAFLSSLVLVPGPDAEAASDDLFVSFSVDNPAIAHGAVSSWTVDVDTSADVTLATAVVVTATVPDGLCPYGAGDPGCPGGTAPVPAFSSATENANGSWTLVWDLADFTASQHTTITYATQTRTNYREGFSDAGPILARDSWSSSVQVTGNVDGTNTSDTTTVGQTAAGIVLAEQIAVRPGSLVQPDVCGNGSTLTWDDASAAGYRIGDQICRRVIVEYPTGLVTAGSLVSMAVPSGQAYTAEDSWAVGSGSTLGTSVIDDSGVVAGGSSLAWDVGDASGYVAAGERLELVYSTTVVDPAATTSGQYVSSVVNHRHTTTPGATITSVDTVAAQIVEAEIDLHKGVVAVNGVVLGDGSGVDGATVREGDVVTYGLRVVNTGDLDASNVVVWDELPAAAALCSSQLSNIGASGSCNDSENRVEWSGAGSLSVSAGSTSSISYDLTIPQGIGPEFTLSNLAGVVSYTTSVNNDPGTFAYRPSANIDGAGSTNTAAASDGSNVTTEAATIVSSRTTSIAEPGNHVDSQATIGELVTYTVTATIPEGTTVYDAELFDDLPANLDLVSSSHTFDGEATLTLSEDPTADSVTVEFPGPSYRNAPGSGEDTVVLTVVARLVDSPANTRGTSISNAAVFTWLDQDGAAQSKSATVSISVVEPLLSVVKTSTDQIGDNGVVIGGEVVDYTLTITNPGTGGVATAHDVVIVDTLPEGMTVSEPVPDGGTWATDGNPGDLIGGTITWNLASLPAGSSTTRTYQVTVDDPVVVSSSFFNTVVVTASSLAGSVADERTVGTGYYAQDSDVLNTPLAGLTRDATPQSVTIGDRVTFTVNVTMPPGTIMYDATVVEALPAGLVFDGLQSSSCDMAGSACDPMISVSEIGTTGTTTAAFSLGDISDSSSTGDSRVVTIEYAAHVLDSGVAGSTRMSVGSLYGNQADRIAGVPAIPLDPAAFDVTVGPAADTLTIVEPRLSIDKDVAGQAGDDDTRRATPGETLVFTISASNAGDSHAGAAYDLTIVDVVPEGLNVDLPLADGGIWVADAFAGDGVGGTITWTVAGPVAPGASVVRTYAAVVDSVLDTGDEQVTQPEAVNTADVVSYFGVAGAERSAYPGYTYREYDDVVADSVQLEFDLASIGDHVWFDLDADGVVDVGEPPLAGVDVTVRYFGTDGIISGDDEIHVVTTASDGSYLSDDLPGGTYTVAVDATDIPAGLVPSYDLDGGTLSPDGVWGPGSLAENEDKLAVDFGYTGQGSIGDAVWFDRDGDGAMDGDEFGLEGVDVEVLWLGLDGVAGSDDVSYRTTTDATGQFQVGYLPAGNYTVTVDSTTLPMGMTPTDDPDGIATPHVAQLTLAAGEVNQAQDFAYAGRGVIGDFVWLDRDGNSAWDPGEPGLIGVPIGITWPGEDGTLGGGDDELFLVATDAGGNYSLSNLPPGQYAVFVLGGLPIAASNTFDEDGGADASVVVALGDAESHLTADFGFQGGSSIGDAVWWDRNGNGAMDAGEPGISGVSIDLTFAGIDGVLGSGDDIMLSTITDLTGSYLFTDLPAGNYRVVVNTGVPAGMNATSDEDGGLDSMSLVPGLGVDEIHLSADFGYIGTGSIGDKVWLDLDGDGVIDPAEPGLPNVTVDLTWFGPDGVSPSPDDFTTSTATDVDGRYSMENLPSGTYRVSVSTASLPSGVAPTYDPDGVATPHTAVMSLAAGENNTAQQFGYFGGSVVGDSVWFDQDGDGTLGAGEYGISAVDVAVIWAGPDGVHATVDDETFVATSDASGSYSVANLPPGQYAVVVDTATLPAGFVAAADEDGVLDGQTFFELTELTVHDTADFGFVGTGEIGDLVWLDRDEDGIAGADEPGIPEQAVRLVAAGWDEALGSADDQVYTTFTDAVGSYSFDNLPPGLYSVDVTGPIVTMGTNTTDADATPDSHVQIDLLDGISESGIDFGYSGEASLAGLVWLDVDANGGSDGEPGLPEIAMTVTWFGADDVAGGGDDVVIDGEGTDPSGGYHVTSLPEGSYSVVVSGGVPAGLVNSVDPDGDQDMHYVAAGLEGTDSLIGHDFGFVGEGSIGGLVWWDLNGDQAMSGQEPGMDDAIVTITWAGLDDSLATSDDSSFELSTAATGEYWLSSLPPGTYEVVVDSSSLPPGIGPVADPDATVDGSTLGELDPGGPDLEFDFGYRGAASIGGVVWLDVDNDGLRDNLEPGVASVATSVVYHDEDGDVVFEAFTSSDGEYVVPGLPTGDFEVVVDESTLPPGYIFADSVMASGVTAISLDSGSHVTDVDYRTIGTSMVHGLVWNDRDGDQFAGNDEVGVAGVEVQVIWSGPTGDVRLAAQTDAFGEWAINYVPPGVYVLEIDPLSTPEGMASTTPTSFPVVLQPAEIERSDFGIALLLAVGTTVWVDENGNGRVDDGEPGVSGATINLYDELGALVDFTETNGDGEYAFGDLYPGRYSVQVDYNSIPRHLRPTWDRDSHPDLLTTVDLTNGVSVLDADFAFQTGLPVTGFDVDVLAIWGALLTLLGIALVGVSRLYGWQGPVTVEAATT